VSGTQATGAVAGTTVLGSAKPTAATAVANDVARNFAANSLANAGRSNTSTGAAISSSSETMVPLSAFSHFATTSTPVSVNHTGTSASTSIAFNLPPGEALQTGLDAIERTIREHPHAGHHSRRYLWHCAFVSAVLQQ
jgi:multidrug efflux pump